MVKHHSTESRLLLLMKEIIIFFFFSLPRADGNATTKTMSKEE